MTAKPSSENQSAAASTQDVRGSGLSVASGSPYLTEDPDGNPYHHDAEKSLAAKMAAAEGDGPVSNETAHAYLRAYSAEYRRKLVEHMAEAFLRWPLPDSVCADLCATKQGPGRIGTNLLSYVEAKQMFEHVLANTSGQTRPAEKL